MQKPETNLFCNSLVKDQHSSHSLVIAPDGATSFAFHATSLTSVSRRSPDGSFSLPSMKPRRPLILRLPRQSPERGSRCTFNAADEHRACHTSEESVTGTQSSTMTGGVRPTRSTPPNAVSPPPATRGGRRGLGRRIPRLVETRTAATSEGWLLVTKRKL